MKLAKLKPGLKIENITVPGAIPRYGVILRIEVSNKSTVTGKFLPVIIGLLIKGKKEYIEWWTSLEHYGKTWRLAHEKEKPNTRRIKTKPIRKNKTKTHQPKTDKN